MKKIKVAILDDYQNVTHHFANWETLSDNEKTVNHNTLGKEKINPEKIFDKVLEIID